MTAHGREIRKEGFLPDLSWCIWYCQNEMALLCECISEERVEEAKLPATDIQNNWRAETGQDRSLIIIGRIAEGSFHARLKRIERRRTASRSWVVPSVNRDAYTKHIPQRHPLNSLQTDMIAIGMGTYGSVKEDSQAFQGWVSLCQFGKGCCPSADLDRSGRHWRARLRNQLACCTHLLWCGKTYGTRHSLSKIWEPGKRRGWA